jgi:hypothetical protein
VLDVAAADGVALADASVPHLLTPFLATPTLEEPQLGPR